MVTAALRRTGFVCDDRYFASRTDEGLGPWVEPGPAFETPEGKRRIRDLLVATGLMDELVPLSPTAASRADCLRFHTPAYLAALQGMADGRDVDVGEATWFGAGGPEMALLSAGGTYAAVHAVLTGEVANAYALVRPPGHHAERDRARGYCLLANIALALLKARAEHGLGRVAVVDWDVHHGNGTEQAFYEDPDTLTISLHQEGLYPRDTGFLGDRGAGAGLGTNLNVPLPAGSGRGAYLAAFEKIVEPALRRFRPELVVVASGFDAGALDPLGRMMLSAGVFGELTTRIQTLAEELCGGRLVLSHEGGYSELHAPFCGLRVLEALSGASCGVEDPFDYVSEYDGQELVAHQAAAVAEIARVHGLGGSGQAGAR